MSQSLNTPRTAREIINEAIRENRAWEWVCWALTICFPVVGMTALVVGVVRDNGLVAASGAVAGALFWPALRAAETIRRANIAIRLLEIPLTRAKTSTEVAHAIRDVFRSNLGKAGTDHVAPPT